MVMETPSPQCVGREFVRQYYTLLHEAPIHLHRFYSHNSCFVHGGVEKPGEELPPVMGQSDIHKKIMSLNFRDCHAKIRQVDSQATVGNAVVVQVTGELSNNGEPMRRFMQTFVLAPQSPKKYYVHNDIFRYQDEVFHDNDSDDAEVTEEARDSEEDVVENGQQVDPVVQDSSSYYEPSQPLSNGSAHQLEDVEESLAGPEDVKDVEDKLDLEEEKFDDKQDVEPSPMSPAAPSTSASPTASTPAISTVVPEVAQEEEEEPQVEPKPFSWAALASKNTSSGSAPPPVSTTAVKSQQARPEPKPDPNQAAASNVAPQPQRAPRQLREQRVEQRSERTSVSRDDGDNDSISGRRASRFPDSHQLFVGNLPHNITEKELKTFFDAYGKVMELRINTKSGGGKLPNFGFVVFDNPQPVQDILKIKQTQPIKYNGEHRLNVEEKKPRGDGRMGGGGGGRGASSRGGGSMGRGSGGFGAPGRGNIRGGGGGMGRGDRGGFGGSTRGGLSMGGRR